MLDGLDLVGLFISGGILVLVALYLLDNSEPFA